jgi:hypothetical protein
VADTLNYAALDPGIRDIVRLLREVGFKTTDSGDGVSKPPVGRVFSFPHVVAAVETDAMVREAERMQACLGDGWIVEASYSTADKAGVLFARKDTPDGD